MPADYFALAAELAKPAYSGLSDAQAAAALNAPGAAVPGVVSPNQLLIWGAMTGARARIEAGKSSPQVASLCLAIGDLLVTGSIGLDCANADNLAMLATLVAAGICTQPQADALVSLGSRPGPSAAARTFGVPASNLDVAHARSL